VAYLAFSTGAIRMVRGGPLVPIITLLWLSVIIGTAVSILVGRVILRPIRRLNETTGRVSRGDFTSFLSEGSRVREIRDMTVHFNQMLRGLGGIETLRSDFIANVSHEFRTPLGTIEGYATLLQGGDLTEEEVREYTGAIIESTRQLSALTGNILKISKLENREIPLEHARFRLDEQIRDVFLALEPRWSSKKLELNIDLADAEYDGNEELWRQVWQNLIENAIKFTPEGGTIGARLTQTPEGIEVAISDTGVGMSQETKERMFEKFFQGDAAHSQEGSGLGLALVRKILDISGSAIDVMSAPGSGTTITVRMKPQGL
jgi:signal transduction histidine kinase